MRPLVWRIRYIHIHAVFSYITSKSAETIQRAAGTGCGDVIPSGSGSAPGPPPLSAVPDQRVWEGRGRGLMPAQCRGHGSASRRHRKAISCGNEPGWIGTRLDRLPPPPPSLITTVCPAPNPSSFTAASLSSHSGCVHTKHDNDVLSASLTLQFRR